MNATETTQPNATEIIQRLGGTTKTADLCEVSAQAVSQWRRNGIPKPQLRFLRLARPELFEPSDTASIASTASQPQ